jgi:hypothetical protein
MSSENERLAKLIEEAEASGDPEKLAAAVKEVEQSIVAGGGVPSFALEGLAEMMQKAIQVAFAEVIATAQAMGATHVPITFLAEVAQAPSTVVKYMWSEASKVDGMIDFGGEIPDDLSGLEL